MDLSTTEGLHIGITLGIVSIWGVATVMLSDLEGKEIVNARDGERLGVFDARDLVLNTDTGRIEGIVVAVKGMPYGRDKRHSVVPWSAIKTVGRDIIIVDMSACDTVRTHIDIDSLSW